jgi:hypothetical protein
VQQAVVQARKGFLRTQRFDRFDVTVLLRENVDSVASARAGRGNASGQRWLRGSVGGNALAYPASTVKLPFLVAAVRWCADRARPPDCLDPDARPMIVESDNVATGRLIDTLTGTVNHVQPSPDAPAFERWLENRKWTERVLDAYGLLAGQRLVNKTYPTNSGDEPSGFELRALREHGRNAMSADASARLLLSIITGQIEPQARDYMRGLLRRARFSSHGSLAAGTPPGTLVENKLGTAFDTLQDVAWLRLPNGRELIVAAFSDGWDPAEPAPGDVLQFGGFTERLIAALDLTRGLPWQRILRAAPRASTAELGEPLHVRVPRAGRYEVTVWFERGPWRARWLPVGEYDVDRSRSLQVPSAALQAARPAGIAADDARLPLRLRIVALP